MDYSIIRGNIRWNSEKKNNYIIIILNILFFDRAGVTGQSQQSIIVNKKVKDLYIIHELDEFLHIEKELEVIQPEVSNIIEK